MSEQLTRQQAINAKCKDCTHDPLAGGTWVAQVEDCTATDCALHEYRPVTEATMAARRAEKVAAMSHDQRQAYKAKAEAARRTLHGERRQPIQGNGNPAESAAVAR